MQFSPQRRSILLATAIAPFVSANAIAAVDLLADAQRHLAALETASGGRLGIAAFNTATGTRLEHRTEERFPFCSTFKVMVAAGILQRSSVLQGLLQKRISYTRQELVSYSPITEQHLGKGMTVAELCAATLQYSDNTAGNLLIKQLGGPAAVTAFARSIGDDVFRLDRWETELNTAIPGDPRDTTTPMAMATSLQRLLLGDALGKPQREQLISWMRGNTTGDSRIRAGVPREWQVADKTGSGDYGTTNDVGVLWPTGKPPIVLAIYFTHSDQHAPYRSEVLALAARIVAEALG